MPRPQFCLKTLLWLMLVVSAFCAGIGFEHERIRREAARLEAESDWDINDQPTSVEHRKRVTSKKGHVEKGSELFIK
jgi:hypothetical protein